MTVETAAPVRSVRPSGPVRLLEARRMAGAEPRRWAYLDQYGNPANPRSHETGTGPPTSPPPSPWLSNCRFRELGGAEAAVVTVLCDGAEKNLSEPLWDG